MAEKTGKVLYVEDNFENRVLIRRVLEAEGYQMFEASTEDEAFRQIGDHHPDIILMDINMPDMDGYTLTAKIKAKPEYKGIPVIAVTANVMRGDKERSLGAGCDGYIQKPIDVDILTEQIERYRLKKDNL
ncbi:MAG: response regulator [Anaerolineae bacterium]|uniref:Response regulator n=1 Tax=Candidatus Desulfolinea nitratireducens TaxID=2841698 RepID=A0A8J6NKX1_9CHLR|nr:response regulator [Candidatus Desulfolinea nitratireducens]MBL6959752.1 response regulator [Anaerolineales bacterium]NQU30845.1 response regulator [Anaerolineae bacterium]